MSLCLAQAQELAVKKALIDSLKTNAVAELAGHAEDLFGEVIKFMQKSEGVRILWDKNCLPIISGKQALYNGLSQYHQSKVCNADKFIGEEISRLQYSLELFSACQIRAGVEGFGGCSDWVKGANRALTYAKKKTNFVYHERIPGVEELQAVGRAAVIKPTMLPDKFLPYELDLFSALMPVYIHQTANDISMQETVGKELNRIKEGTIMLNEMLNSMNLPAALQDKTGGGVPASLKVMSAAVNDDGGVDKLERLVSELPDLPQRNIDLLSETERMLKEEVDCDTTLSILPSDKLTGIFISNANKYRTSIINATQEDAALKEKFDTHMQGLKALAGCEAVIGQMLQNGAKLINTNRLKELMLQIEILKLERAVIESELKGTNPGVKYLYLLAAASEYVNKPGTSLGISFGSLQEQVALQHCQQCLHFPGVGWRKYDQAGEDHCRGAGPVPAIHTGEGWVGCSHGAGHQIHCIGWF